MTNPDDQTIDLDGISVSLSNIADFGQARNASEITRAQWDALCARQIGQVSGAVLDDADQPNLYLAATSAYGVLIVGRDGNLDGLPDRLRKGGTDARYMAGPRMIWRVDNATGKVEVFANLAPEGAADTAASLGNLAYDAALDALFVRDLETECCTVYAPLGWRRIAHDLDKYIVLSQLGRMLQRIGFHASCDCAATPRKSGKNDEV